MSGSVGAMDLATQIERARLLREQRAHERRDWTAFDHALDRFGLTAVDLDPLLHAVMHGLRDAGDDKTAAILVLADTVAIACGDRRRLMDDAIKAAETQAFPTTFVVPWPPATGSRASILVVLDRVLPAHVHLVALAVLSRPPRRFLGWLVPLALWLLERAGVVLVRREGR